MPRYLNFAWLTLFSVAALTGCASYFDGRPRAGVIAVSEQAKLQSASHWQIVADDIASQISKTLKSRNLPATPLWVPPAAQQSKFSSVFASQLRSGLLRQGVSVSDGKESALEVSITVEDVRHGVQRRYAPGTLTALTAGILVLRDAVLGDINPGGAIAAIGIGSDIALSVREAQKIPNTEIVLTTAIKKDGLFIVHKTDVYYVDDVDSGLFTPGKEFKVVGASS